MKVSLSWLSSYMNIDVDTSKIAEAITMQGLEVDSVVDRFSFLSKVLVGQIIAIDPHPNAENLKICQTVIGDKTLQIVCGAPNVTVGQKVPVALDGAQLPNGHIIRRNKIRGELSEGMICSESELGLGINQGGILILDKEKSEGVKLNEALKLSDEVIEFDLTPNRADCLSILGIAREVSAIIKATIEYPDSITKPTVKEINGTTRVDILATDLCPRYACSIIEDIKVEPSPFWLQDRLMSVGLRPINNIVDVTNYVMLEMGQPLHAFDLDRLKEQRIVVRKAEDGETFTTLDEKEHQLQAGMLLICDAEKPVALAGVMGGMNSEIVSDSSRVLLESAYFLPASVRKTAKKLGISTDASHRFERGVDPLGTVKALNRASQLIKEIANGHLHEDIIDENYYQASNKSIYLDVDRANQRLGINLSKSEVSSIFSSIEFEVKNETGHALSVCAPSYRVDIQKEEDLFEEVARLYGYNNIPTTFPLMPAQALPCNQEIETRKKFREILVGLGFSEVINYSFADPSWFNDLKLPENDTRRDVVSVLNPLTEDQSIMRSTLLPGMLKTVHRNISHQVKNIKIFEIGKVFHGKKEDGLPYETEFVTALWTGSRTDDSWYTKETHCDYFDIKGTLEYILNILDVQNGTFTKLESKDCPYLKPGVMAKLLIADNIIGEIGEIKANVLTAFQIKQPVYIFEIDLSKLKPYILFEKVSEPLPRFPAIARDATLILDRDIEVFSLISSIRSIKEKYLEDVFIFDVYEGDPIAKGKKSISFRIKYRSPTSTLKDSEINVLHDKIISEIIERFQALLP